MNATEAAPRRRLTFASRTGAPPVLWMPPAVTVRCGAASVVGYAECVTDTEVLVQGLEAPPEMEGACEVVFDYPEGEVTASGVILNSNRDSRLLRVSLERLVGAAEPALAAAILAEEDGAAAIEEY